MKGGKKAGQGSPSDDEIRPIDNPSGAIDFYMPLPDQVYKRWKSKK